MNASPFFLNASWIASPLAGSPGAEVPAPYLRKPFFIGQPVKAAHLHVTALGLYECEINGRRVGDRLFTPGWTDYRKRVQFQSYDVASLLREGENVVGAILGNGWYSGYLAWFGKSQFYGQRPQFLARLEVTLADGSTVAVGTGDSWKTSTGPLLQNDLMMGETYDARLELAGWSAPAFDDSQWQNAILPPEPDAQLVVSAGPPVRRIEELKPVAVAQSQPHLRIFDFGQNFAGRVRIAVVARRGSTVTIRHAEVLNPDGSLYTDNLRNARATDYYTCAGSSLENWEPRFTFHGFRYVEIGGLADGETVEVTGLVLHSDMPPTGSFSCSNPLLNQLRHNIAWGQKSNFLEVPTDCPQRDERLGWTGDAQVFARTACFNLDVRGFFHKWMQDLRDAQHEDGGIPPVVPEIFPGDLPPDGGPAWADAAIICPWTVYLCYGDKTILKDHYECMRRFMAFMAAHRCKGAIRSHPEVDPWGGFGDWLALDGSGKTEGGTPRDLIGTAFYAYDAAIMAQTALVLGREEDARSFQALYQSISDAFQRRFVTPEGLLASGTQTAYVLALHFGLVPEPARATAAAELVNDIRRREFHLSTGFVGTPYLLDVLENNGYLDIAYKLLEQETFPSWLFPVKNGATTIWERWDGWTPEKGFQDKGMNSFNHYAYGAVGAWMVRTVAGLDLDPACPGYAHILFRPRPGGSITWAKAKLITPQGETSIHWKLENEALHLDLLVPAGARATLHPPQGWGRQAVELKSGRHQLALERLP